MFDLPALCRLSHESRVRSAEANHLPKQRRSSDQIDAYDAIAVHAALTNPVDMLVLAAIGYEEPGIKTTVNPNEGLLL